MSEFTIEDIPKVEADLATPITGIPQSTANPLLDVFGQPDYRDDHEKAMDTWRQESFTALDAAVIDPKSYGDERVPSGYTPDEWRKTRVVDDWMRLHSDGEAPPMGLSREFTRARLAEQVFGGAGAENDDALYGEITKAATGRKDERDLARELTVAAFDDAMLPSDQAPGFKAFREKLKAHAGYRPENGADYVEAWHETRRAAKEKVDEFREPLVQVWRAFKTDGNVTAAAYDAYSKLTPEQRPQFMDALAIRARALPDAERATFWANMGQQTGQAVADYGRNAAESATSMGLAQPTDPMVGLADAVYGTENYTESETGRKQAKEDFQQARNFAADVRKVAREDYDPLQSAFSDGKPGFWEGVAYQAPGVTVTSLSMAIPYVGVATMAFSMEGQAYEGLRGRMLAGGMDDATATAYAEGIAPFVALPQAALEKVGFAIWSRKLPGFSKVMDTLGDKIANRALRFGAKTLTIGTAETGIELLQDATEYAVQDIAAALTEDVPDVDWSKELSGTWAQAPEIFATMLPLAILGAAGGLNAESRQAAFARSSQTELEAYGINPEGIAAIQGAQGPASLASAIESAMETRDPNTEAAAAAVAELKQKAASQRQAVEDLERLGYAAPTFTTTPEGVFVFDSEGNELGMAQNYAGASRIAAAHTTALVNMEQDRVDALTSLMEGVKAAVGLDPTSETEVNLGEFDPAQATPGMAARFAAQVALKERAEGGTGNIARSVLGYSVTEMAQGVRHTVNRLFKGASITDAFHETGHGLRRKAHAAGTVTRAMEASLLINQDTVYAGRRVRDAQGKQQGTDLRLVPDGITAAMLETGEIPAAMIPAEFDGDGRRYADQILDEGVSEIIEAEVLKLRKGKGRGKLGITRELVQKNLQAMARLNATDAKSWKSFFAAVRGHWGLAMSRAVAMAGAERRGEFDPAERDAYLDKLLGLDQQTEHDAGVQDEFSRMMAGFDDVDMEEDDIPFSIGRATPKQDADYLAAVEAGDMETAQAMVDQAAKAAGLSGPFFHGTNASFKKFDMTKGRDGAHFFSVSKEHAEHFGTALPYYVIEGRIMEANQDDLDALWDAAHPDQDSPNFETDQIPRMFIRDLVEKARAEGYDTLAIRGLADVGGEFDVYLPLNSDQIKSAEAITRDESGKIIPLSQRFNPASDSISFSIGRASVTPTASTRSFQGAAGSPSVIGPAAFSIGAFHGTPHQVDKFRTAKIGTGEGAQAYGWGLYFADSEKVAEEYRNILGSEFRMDGEIFLKSGNFGPAHRRIYDDLGEEAADILVAFIDQGKDRVIDELNNPLNQIDQATFDRASDFLDRIEATNSGNLYRVTLKVDDEDLLDWDKPLSEQSEKVRAAILSQMPEKSWAVMENKTGQSYYEFYWNARSAGMEGDIEGASRSIAKLGIKGIRYLDGNSRLQYHVIDGEGVVRFRTSSEGEAKGEASLGLLTRNGGKEWRVEKQEGSYNYVVFDEADIEILEENGTPVDLGAPAFSIGVTVAPVRKDALSELTKGEVQKRSGSAKFIHLQQVASDVAAAYGVKIEGRQPTVGGWTENGEVSLEVPEVITFATDDLDIAEEMAALIAASAPELQNAAMIWRDDDAGEDNLVQFTAKSAAAALTIAQDLEMAGVQGFSYDTQTREFSLVLAGVKDEDVVRVHEYVQYQTKQGSVSPGKGVTLGKGSARFPSEGDYRKHIENARSRADNLGGAQGEAIREIASRAERRVDRYEAALKISKKAKRIIKKLPLPMTSAKAIIHELKGRTFDSIRALGLYLDDRFQKINGFASFPVGSAEGITAAAEAFTYDILDGLSRDGSGMGWYDERVTETIRELVKLHPEFAQDPLSLAVYIGILSTTSQGYTVVTNFAQTERVWEIYKDTGRIPTDLDFAKSTEPINQNLAEIQALIDTHGLQGYADFMDEIVTGKTLRDQYGMQPTGVTLIDEVRGNRFLGPKIGSFFNNLRGRFDTITMDLWYTRTMHRYLGETVVPLDNPKVQKALKSFRDEIQKEGARTYNIDIATALESDEATVRAALTVFGRWGAGKNDYTEKGYTKFKDGYKIEKAARTIHAEGTMKGAPQNKSYRTYFAAVVKETKKNLAELGIKLTEADIQAIIWYREKNMFAETGVANNAAKPADYLDAVMVARQKAEGSFSIGGMKAANWAEYQSQGRAFSGADGKPRFEMDASQAAFNPSAIKDPARRNGFKRLGADSPIRWLVPDGMDTPLGNILAFDELYENYPQLAGLKVNLHHGDPSTFGSFARVEINGKISLGFSTIYLSDKLTAGQAFSTLLHEVQHAIQQVEGFSPGSSPEAETKEYNRLRARYNGIHSSDEMREYERKTEEVFQKYDRDEITAEEMYATIQALGKSDPAYKELLQVTEELQSMSHGMGEFNAHRAYRNRPGEKEARGVQARQSMTAEQRAATPFMDQWGSFSLGPAQVAGILSDNALSRITDPRRRTYVMSRIARDFNAMRLQIERITSLSGIRRSKGDLRREAMAREDLAAEEKIAAIHQRFGSLLADEDLVKIKSQLVHAYLSDPTTPLRGKLMSKKQAIKNHPDQYQLHREGHYDGSDNVSRSVFGGTWHPADAAQNLFDEGLISEPTADAMWRALLDEQQSVAGMKEMLAKAQEEIRAAKAEAKQEANEWLATQGKDQEVNFSDKEEIRRSLRMLDAILLALPAEIRGKIGGYTQISMIASDDARLAYLKDKLAKADKELESFLRVEYAKEWEELLKKAAPQTNEAGQRPTGSIAADAYDVFRVAEHAMGLGFAEGEAEADKWDAIADHPDTDPKDVDLARVKAQMIRLTMNWPAADAARREQAVLEGDKIYFGGLRSLAIENSRRRERLGVLRDSAVKGTGKTGHRMEREAAKQATATKLGAVKAMAWEFLSFGQVVNVLFGEKSDAARWMNSREIAASNGAHDGFQSKANALESLFDTLSGNRFDGEKLRHRMATDPRITVKDVLGVDHTFTESQAITFLLMYRQEDGKRHLQGLMDDAGKVVSEWAWDDKSAATIEAGLSSEGRAAMAFLGSSYGEEYGRINDVFRRIWNVSMPRHKMYAPLSVKPVQGKGDTIMDPVSGDTMGAGMTPGSLKNRSFSAIAEPDFKDAFQVYLTHARQMEHFIAYAEFSRDALGIINRRETRNSIEAAGGADAAATLSKWVDYFALGGVHGAAMGGAWTKILGGMLGRLSQAALVGRVSVLCMQSLQLAAASFKMPTGAFLTRFAKLSAGRLQWGDTIRSEYIQRRLQQLPPVVRDMMQGMASGTPNRAKYLAGQMGRSIAGADALFTAGTYAIFYDYHLGLAKKAGIANPEAHAHAEAERFTDQVAQPVRTGARSWLEVANAGNPAFRAAWNYSSDPRQKMSLLVYAAMRRDTTGKEKAGDVAFTAAKLWIVGGVLQTLMRTVLRDLRNDDDDEIFDERYWSPARLALQVGTGPLGAVPFLGGMMEDATYKLTGQFAPQGGMLAFLDQAAGLPKKWAGGKVEPIKDVETLTTAGAGFSGTSAAAASAMHILRDVVGFIENLEGPD